MTLRARLTAAFLAVVLGPVLLGALFVGITVATVSRSRSAERLDIAAFGVHAMISVRCQRLQSAAEAAVLLTGPRGSGASGTGSEPDPSGWGAGARTRATEAAQHVVNRRLAGGVMLVASGGTTVAGVGAVPPAPWADCSWPAAAGAGHVGERDGGLMARAEIIDANGSEIGYAVAVDPIDSAFLAQLDAAAGEDVRVDPLGDGMTGTGSSAVTGQASASAGPGTAGPAAAGPGAANPGSGGSTAGASSTAAGNPGMSAPAGARTAHPGSRDQEARDAADVARKLTPGTVGRTASGRFVRRLDPDAGQPLQLVLSAPPSETEGLYAVLVAVVISAGLVAVAMAWILARSTTRPLTELAIAVDRVAAGDLAARVPIRSSDEVGRLGTTFNRMTREMQGYVQALTASRDQLRGQLGVLGDTLSSTHDLNRILQVIMQTAAAATGAQAGVVLLLDPATGLLVGQCAEGLRGRGAPADVTELRLRVGEGLLGAIAASGEPRRGRVDRDRPVFAPNEPNCLTYIAVPLVAPTAGPTTGLEPAGEVTGGPASRGVLALYDRHGFDEFDDADLVTLRTFAGQAAVALENVRVHEEAQRLSLTDALTGLSNYRYLRESLRREVERASRFGHNLAVLVLDLDHFKEINDTYGHAAGDAVLAEFARRVRAEIREVDFAFRQGGEEFVVLLPETDAAGAEVVAQRLGEAVRRTPVIAVPHQATRPLRVAVTVSVGAAVYPCHGETGLAVLEAADDALYAAKAAGRDTFCMAGSTGA